jgi:hypothetical protein
VPVLPAHISGLHADTWMSNAVVMACRALQVNFAHNKLSGEVPSTLQQLAAVRPVRVTMKDG